MTCFTACVVAACSGTSSDDGTTATVDDPLVTEASDETRSALGVALWGVRIDPMDGTAVVRGYNGSNESLVELRQKSEDGAGMDTVSSVSVTGWGSHARMKVKTDRAPTADSPDVATLNVAVLENSFAANPKARQVVEQFEKDTRARPPHARAPGGKTAQSNHANSLVGSADGSLLNPGDASLLTGSCIELSSPCAKGLGTMVSAGAGSAARCGTLTKDTTIQLTCAGDTSCSAPAGSSVSSGAQECAIAATAAAESGSDMAQECQGQCGIVTAALPRLGRCSCQHRDVFTSGGQSCLTLRTSGVCSGPYTGVGLNAATCQAAARAAAPLQCQGCLGHCLFRR
ncbi:hypothetical protein [Pendulispora albinea]|uniref:Uncharacterized protein n=1 Tax=Pendulispora albinea TaxID=2741071 RepID=A0ABZ2M106_9BACT